MTVDPDPPGISFRGVSRAFGSHRVLHAVDADAPAGQVTVLVGPNGSGKTTLLRILLGLDRPDAGRATLHGRTLRQTSAPWRRVGALLDAGWVHPGRSARNHLLWMARTAGIPAARCTQVLETVGLTHVARQPVGSYSLGMRQRLGIASTLLGEPDVLVFDEPLNGLDSDGVQWFQGFVSDRARRGGTVLLASHQLADLAPSAQRVIVLGRPDGGVLFEGTPEELQAQRAEPAGHVLVAVVRSGVDLTDLLAHAERAGWRPALRASAQLTEIHLTGAELTATVELCERLGVPLETIGRGTALEAGYRRLTAAAGAHRSAATTASGDGPAGVQS